MNTPDDFERQLSAREPKRLPESWRVEILSAAYAERADTKAQLPANRERLSAKHINLAALAAVWIVIGFLHFTGERSGRALPHSGRVLASQEFTRQWQLQQRMVAELMDVPQPQPKAKPQPAPVPVLRRSGNRRTANASLHFA